MYFVFFIEEYAVEVLVYFYFVLTFAILIIYRLVMAKMGEGSRIMSKRHECPSHRFDGNGFKASNLMFENNLDLGHKVVKVVSDAPSNGKA